MVAVARITDTVVVGRDGGVAIVAGQSSTVYGNVPAGGALGYVLTKLSGADWDYDWAVSVGGGGGVTDGDKGDVIVSGVGTVWTLDPLGTLAGYQPLDSDLTAIAALSTTAFGRSLLALADAAALRTAAGGLDARYPELWIAQIVPVSTVVTTGNTKGDFVFRVPAALNGYTIGIPEGSVSTTSSVNNPTAMLHRLRLGGSEVNVLSTALTVDATELDSSTAPAAVVNATNATMQTGDLLYWEIITGGTGTKGFNVMVPFTP